MSLTRIKSTKPQLDSIEKIERNQMLSGTIAEAFADAANIGNTISGYSGTGFSGKYAPVLVESHVVETDEQYPGHARTMRVYRSPDIEEWLISNLGKAVVYGSGGIARKPYSIHDLSNDPVEGWGSGIKLWRKTDGEPVKITNHHVDVVHGYTDSLATILAWRDKCGHSNNGTLTNLGYSTGQAMLIDVSYKPVIVRGSLLYSFDLSIVPTESYVASCTSIGKDIGSTTLYYLDATGRTHSRTFQASDFGVASTWTTANWTATGLTTIDAMLS